MGYILLRPLAPTAPSMWGQRISKLYAINPNGTQKWAFTTGGWVYSSPAIGADGTIYVGSDDHKLYAVNPNGTQKWAFNTGIAVDSSPAIGADGTIYVGSVGSMQTLCHQPQRHPEVGLFHRQLVSYNLPRPLAPTAPSMWGQVM